MTAHHIVRWADGARNRAEKMPICGQANSHAATVLGPGEQIPTEGAARVTCRRCIKRQLAAQPDGSDR